MSLDVNNPINQLTSQIIDSAFKIHKFLGPGLLEGVYEEFLAVELTRRNIIYKRQAPISVEFEGTKVEVGLRLDFLVNNQVVVELKAVEKVLPVHQAQIMSYLKLAKMPVGLLINFHVQNFQEAVKRFVI